MNIPHPKSWFNPPPADRDEPADRPRPGEVDFKRLLTYYPPLDMQRERVKTAPGKLPLYMSEERDPRGRLLNMKSYTIWEGYLLVREVGSHEEAQVIHGELEKLLLGAVK